MTIKEAAKELKVEAHVLRYWEEELGLNIKRNEMGHRYYNEKDIRMFKKIMELKESKLSLKEIREAIEGYRRQEDNSDVKVVDFKIAQMQSLMNKIVANALRENKGIIGASLKAEITEDVMKQMDIIIKDKEQREEERFRKLDEVLRKVQLATDEVAATRVRKKGWGRKR